MKAILVIDMPKNCVKCKLMYLQGIGESICNVVDWEERPSWCPLKPMPERKAVTFTKNENVDYILGWNACLEEIEKNVREAKHD